ncbi:SpoIID/LytB domain-containing protein [Qiania dongpingensis]|uniref:SpoIID/LytB domain-containing protein n=1 Tax=Qiania dongpingensis TaxID=2763669 RepID=A0A7G9G1P3_9FIRM|nr:SpoIID/LytB domain-containing protein [Qiania dongpingensis]QNM04725.1 SpoIID/LytB domain-containing protein [Qiania dongpingensis]
MKRNFLLAAGGTILLFLFPYMVTLFITGKITMAPKQTADSGRTVQIKSEYGTEEIDLEDYVQGVAASQIPGNYEKEAVKAQVIIARTYLYKMMGDETAIAGSELSCGYWDTETRKKEWGDNYLEYQEKFKQAASESAGQVLTYQGSLIDAMFHRASAGKTRDGGELLPYIKSVDSSQDVDMEGYVTIREYSAPDLVSAISSLRGQQLTDTDALGLQIAARDDAGYVQSVMAGTETYTGEEVASVLSLPSSAFSITQSENGIKFVDKGSGHGYGLSQWGANKLAGEGKDAAAILAYYYQNVSIEKK